MPDSSHVEEPTLTANGLIYPEPEAMDLASEILAQLTEGVVTLADDDSVVSWNPVAASLTGYTLAEMHTLGLPQLFDAPEEFLPLIRQAHTGCTSPDVRLVLTRADGQRIPVGVRCSPLRNLGNTSARVAVVMRDLSELETLQNRLLQSERLGILGRLAGAVSHEIRNPLTAIFLHTDVLEDELRQPDGGNHAQLVRSLRAIKHEVTHLYDLVQQYLSLARLSDLRRELVELGAYMQEIAADIEARLTGSGILLRLERNDGPLHVALHRSSFRRLLLNLVHNAIEAMPQGGTLLLRLRSTTEYACLDISDTGCGVPPEQLPLLFSPFHTTKPEGTGLGLYLVQEIVTAHHGEITVCSTPGVGTTFTVLLPRLDAAASLVTG
jgi:PAS domain S-box-containing protein